MLAHEPAIVVRGHRHGTLRLEALDHLGGVVASQLVGDRVEPALALSRRLCRASTAWSWAQMAGVGDGTSSDAGLAVVLPELCCDREGLSSALGPRLRMEGLLLHRDVPQEPLPKLGVNFGVDGAVWPLGLAE